MQRDDTSTFQFVDNRPEAIAQSKIQENTNNSLQVSQLSELQDIANQKNIEKTDLTQKEIDERFVQEQLGNAFDNQSELNPDQKKYREEDTNNRLKDPKMISCYLNEIDDDATWDFKHWMIEGEMPPMYGLSLIHI